MKLFQPFNVTPQMESNQPLSRDVLHEDLQILRHTLAAISDDVRRLSPFSAQAVERAIQDLDMARSELASDGEFPIVAEPTEGITRLPRPSDLQIAHASRRSFHA